VDQASHLGHSSNRRELASSGVSFVLDVGLQSQPDRRTEACQQRGPGLDLPYGFRESDLGSTAHSRRAGQAGFRSLGKERLAVDPTNSERSRFREAMADVPQKPSRGHCGDGFFHRPNAHFWCFVLACRLTDYADFGQVTSPFPLFGAEFLALPTNCVRHNPAVSSPRQVRPCCRTDLSLTQRKESLPACLPPRHSHGPYSPRRGPLL
jgi:hypothetical protein